MTYQEAYNFLIALHNIPRQEYLKNKKKSGIYLKRLQFLLDILDNPEKKIPHYVHITGTSGKGSVAIMTASILRALGKKIGLLTSPHPSVITERWEVNGKKMNKKEFVRLIEKIKPALDEYMDSSPYDFPSFFEIVTALGLLYFSLKKVEWAILEVGLGGKNDSTNVIPYKDLAIITNIGTDHADLIGPAKADIAREKSGIIKPGAVVLTAEADKNILKIIEAAAKKQKIKQVKKLNAQNIKYKIIKTAPTGTDFIYRDDAYHLPVMGTHQMSNAILAIEAGKILNIGTEQIKRGLATARFPLRLEMVSKEPLIILDGAHNVEKMQTTVETITEMFPKRKIRLVVGFSDDKDTKTMLKQLASLKPISIACARSTSNPFRTVAYPQRLARETRKLCPQAKITSFLDPQMAFEQSKKQTKANELLLVTGSIFLSGELHPNLTSS